MSKPLNFMGIGFYELIDFFDLQQKKVPVIVEARNEDGTTSKKEIYKKKEVETLPVIINGSKVIFEINEKSEVELIKLKKFLRKNETNQEVVGAVKSFMKALIKKSETLDYNAPGFKGVLEIEDDSTFMYWVVENVENMWI
ncbi:hypothetical protein NSQ62_08430 [Solibacillus sp. FSL H8-0523]|uniref:hypothetical protein n=1 Tax=Solibacillus sp. FSL H8-0523 TaxID=2954511 RepID=UPI003100BF51